MGGPEDIRGDWKQVVGGRIVAFMIRLVGLTLRYRFEDPHGHLRRNHSQSPVIWVFWHNCLFSVPLVYRRFSGEALASALTSASRDGALIASVVKSFGARPIRGSSSRRGMAALIAMKKAIAGGDHAFITPDGPRGPRHHLQPGVVKLSQSAAVPIIAVSFHHSASWRLKSWDRFHIPKPFSRVIVHLGESIQVPPDVDKNDFELYRLKVENALGRGDDDIED